MLGQKNKPLIQNFYLAIIILALFHESISSDLTKMNSIRKLAVDFEIYGIVQGVFFRKYTQKKARELLIRGWCKNTRNDTVLGQMEGEEKQIQKMKDWLKTTGSPSSRIDKAEFRNEREIVEYSFQDFSVKH